jgi:hypothetical protein
MIRANSFIHSFIHSFTLGSRSLACSKAGYSSMADSNALMKAPALFSWRPANQKKPHVGIGMLIVRCYTTLTCYKEMFDFVTIRGSGHMVPTYTSQRRPLPLGNLGFRETIIQPLIRMAHKQPSASFLGQEQIKIDSAASASMLRG